MTRKPMSSRWVDSLSCRALFVLNHRLNMRLSLFAVLALVLPLSGCHLFHFSSKPASYPAEAPVAKAAPGVDYGPYPQDYQMRTVEAFQAKWPADVVYRYRFELPRRVQNTYSSRNGYAVRFCAQKVTLTTPLPGGFPWVAYFEYGKIVWVQRDTAAASTIKWFDPVQATVDWPPVAPAN